MSRGARRLRWTVLWAALWCPVSSAQAQTPLPLTLDDARARAVALVPDISIQRDAVRLAIEAEQRAAAAFDPVVRIDSRVRSRTDPLNTLFSGAPAGALGPRTTGVSTSTSWSKLLTSGGSLTGHVAASADGTNNVLALLTPAYQAAAGLEIRQPLMQGRRTDAARQRLRLADIGTTRTRAQLRQTVADVVAAVERAYWAAAAAGGQVGVRERALALARAQRRDTELEIEAGTAAEADLATSDAAVTSRHLAVIAAQEAMERAHLALKMLIARDPDDALWSAPLQLLDTPAPPPLVDEVDALVAEALHNRPEMALADAQSARTVLDVESAADRLRPQVDIVGAYTLRGLAGREHANAMLPFPGLTVSVDDDLQGVWGQAWRNAAGHRFVDASLGVSVTVPVGNRLARADAAAADIARDQARAGYRAVALRVAHDVRLAAARLDAARARRAAAVDAAEAASRQLAAEQDRNAGGISSAFLLLTRQTELADAESALLTADADQAVALTELDHATGRLLASRAIDISGGPSHDR